MQVKSFLRKLKKYFRKQMGRVRRIGLRNRDFTIISNNCTGGYIYQYFGLKYNTPTAGLFFSTKDFVKFCKNIDHYLKQDMIFLDSYNEGNESKGYPIGLLDDIKVHFLHYKSIEEAKDKWNRRSSRINLDDLYFMYCENGDCSSQDIEDFCAINKAPILCFTYKNYSIEGATYCSKLAESGNFAWTRKIVLGLIPWKKYLNHLK